MEKNVTIFISDVRSWVVWLRHTVGTIVLVILPITFGVAADSSAMQWAGFFFGVVLLFSIAKRWVGQSEHMTIDQASAYLDKMEAGHD